MADGRREYRIHTNLPQTHADLKHHMVDNKKDKHRHIDIISLMLGQCELGYN